MDVHRLTPYLPQDRLRALAHGVALPDRATGSALFADISGFTPLTEKLTRDLGPRRGAEDLTRQINAVYDALIAEVARYGGSVISFAGDAITGWFDEDRRREYGVGSRTTACALAMQAAMTAFPHLGLKVAVASGPARRLVVGDPAIQQLDVLAGATVARLATGEHLAARGEVLVDAPTAAALGDAVTLSEWRTAETGERFAVLREARAPDGDLVPASAHLPAEILRPWVLSAVFEREHGGQAAFLTELRPAVALFLRFTGIDYDGDAQAGDKLDALVRAVQAAARRYDGTLLAVIIGDKGSYLYLAFGALTAHEDDAQRAALAALELRALPMELVFLAPLQIGVSMGVMRVGAYGGTQRRTYGAIGDAVNLAARLMQAAQPGQVILSARVWDALQGHFSGQALPPLAVKGKAEPVVAWALWGAGQRPAVALHEPAYTLPLVGREAELALVGEKFAQVLQGHGHIVGITAEAGLGKSRLVAEIIRLVAETAPLAHTPSAIYAGACQSYGFNTAYLVWRDIWRGLFQLDSTAPVTTQIHAIEQALAAIDPLLPRRAPLLGLVLDIPIPDNDLTRSLDAKLRKESLAALLVDCLKARAARAPLVLVLEDVHWLDPLSHDLLEAIGRAIVNLPVLIVLAYRPPELARVQEARVMALPHATEIRLTEFTPPEAARLIALKLAHLGVPAEAALLQAIQDQIIERAQGNPFFIEETLNYLRDQAPDWHNPQAVAQLAWPDSLHTLILSRMDTLTEHQKLTLKVASIIGRTFSLAWLHGYYPALGEAALIKADLDELHRLNITLRDTPEPELAYVFKHIIIQEVIYASLPYATRARLHAQLAHYLEAQIAAHNLPATSLLNTLVYHYEHTENRAKQREYLQKASQAALVVSAFTTAVEYLTRLLALIPAADAERSALALQLAEAHYYLGDFPAARAAIQQAQAAAQSTAARVTALSFLGEMTSSVGDYATALTVLTEAAPLARASADALALCRTLYALGDVYWRLDDFPAARAALTESLALARALGDVSRELFALNRLAMTLGDEAEEERLYHEVYALAVATGNRERATAALNNLGVLAGDGARQDYALQRAYFQQALVIAREIGDQHGIAHYLINLAIAAMELGELESARADLREGLALAYRLGVLGRVVTAVVNFGYLAQIEGQAARALALYGLAHRHPAWSSEHQRQLNRSLTKWGLDPVVVADGLAQGATLDWDATVQALLKA